MLPNGKYFSSTNIFVTFEINSSLRPADHLDSLIVGLVAFEPHAFGAHEPLLALQHQDRPGNMNNLTFKSGSPLLVYPLN